MFTGITWAEYFMTVAILSGAYYTFIGLRYYRAELAIFARSKTSFLHQTPKPDISAPPGNREPKLPTEEPEHPIDEVDEFITRLRVEISLAAAHESDKETIRERIALLIGEFPEVNQPALRPSLNELIISECEQQGSVRLSAVELNQIWEEV